MSYSSFNTRVVLGFSCRSLAAICPLQGSSSASVPQRAKVPGSAPLGLASFWGAGLQHWHVPLKLVSWTQHCAASGQVWLCDMGLILTILPPQWLSPQNPKFTKEDARVSFCYWKGDFLPSLFTATTACSVQTSTPPGSFSRAFHSAWAAARRTSGQCIVPKLDPTGACGWAV